LKGPTDDAAIREVIEDRYWHGCQQSAVHRSRRLPQRHETWIVLAARTEQPKVEDSAAVAARVLELVTPRVRSPPLRSPPVRCGGAARLSRTLTEAASSHARDMAEHASFDHRGTDGSQPSERVSRVGYRWRATGENIAAGQVNADAVVAAWLDSPGHCTNIMGPQFTEMGVALALAPSGTQGSTGRRYSPRRNDTLAAASWLHCQAHGTRALLIGRHATTIPYQQGHALSLASRHHPRPALARSAAAKRLPRPIHRHLRQVG